jgi:O-antigen/teichoic acid export membrane protein
VKQLVPYLTRRLTLGRQKPLPQEGDPDLPPSLKINFSWTILGNLVYGISQILLFGLISKLGTPEILGQYTLGIAIVTPTMMFANLQLRTLQATDAGERYRFRDYFELRCLTVVVSLVFLAVLALCGPFGSAKGGIIFLVGLAKAIEAISDLFYGALQQRECLERIAKSMVYRSILSLLSFALLFYGSQSLPIACLGLVGSALFVLFAYDVRSPFRFFKDYQVAEQAGRLDRLQAAVKLWMRPSWPVLGELFKVALPVGVVIMLLSLCSNIPRYFIEGYWGSRDLGIFAALSYVPISGVIVVSACGQSALPRLARYYACGDVKRFQKLTFQLLGIALALGSTGYIGALLVGKPLLSLLYSSEYAEQSLLFSRLMLWGGLHYAASLMGSAAAAAQYFRSSLVLAAFRTLVTIVTSWLFIQHQGLQGAVLSLVVDETVQLIGLAMILIHALNKIRKLSEVSA